MTWYLLGYLRRSQEGVSWRISGSHQFLRKLRAHVDEKYPGRMLLAEATLLTAFVTRRTILKGPSRPMVLELPSYKTPSLRNALLVAFDQGLGLWP